MKNFLVLFFCFALVGTALAGIQLNPTSLNFGSVNSSTGASSTVKVTNTGDKTKTFTVTVSSTAGQFAVTPSSLSLAAGGQGTVTVSIPPGSAPGSYSGTLTVSSESKTVTATLTASVASSGGTTGTGTGTSGNIIGLNPASLDFGTIDKFGQGSLNYTLTNGSSASVTFNLSVTGSFSTQVGALTLSAGQAKSINVTFPLEPGNIALGNQTGAITITGGGQTATLQLKAKVVDLFASSVSPASLDFGAVTLGQSKALDVTVKNDSAGALTFTGSPTPSVYTVSPAVSVAAGQTGILHITCFSAQETGLTGNIGGLLDIKVTSGSSGGFSSLPTVSLAASFVNPLATSLSPSILDYGTVVTGATKSLTLTIKNDSTASHAYAVTSSSSLFTISPASPTIAANSSQAVSVTFAPGTTQGAVNGTITVKTNNVSVATAAAKGAGAGTFTVTASATGKGNVSGAGLFCGFTGTTCSKSITGGTSVPITADPLSDNVFVNWTNGTGSATTCNNSTNPTCTVVIQQDSSIRGNFVPGKPDLVGSITNPCALSLAGSLKNVTCSVKARNAGTAFADASSGKIFFDGTAKQNFVVSLTRVDSTTTVSVSFTVPLTTVGTHTIKIQLDVTNVIAESNETNNISSISMGF